MSRGAMLVMALFFLQPVAIGCWLALIPHVKATLGLTKAELALALLGMPSALLLALQFAGRAVAAVGVRRLFLLAFPLQGAAAMLPVLAIGQGTLFLGLAAFGAAAALMEVALNVYAGRIEKRSGRLVMNRCHGFWALGLMAGSLLATGGAATVGVFGIMALSAAISAGAGIAAARALPTIGEVAPGAAPARRRLTELPRALFAIGAFMLLVTMAEGAMADWSAVYLSERLSVVEDAGIAVTIFSGFMAAGRFAGDALKHLLGALALGRGSVALAMAGLLCLVLPLPLAFAHAGFALVGLGVAAGYPLGVSAVAALDDRHEAGNVAIMSTCALAGFLLGPPMVGLLGEAYGLRTGLAALLPGLAACLWLAAWLAPGPARLRAQDDTAGERG